MPSLPLLPPSTEERAEAAVVPAGAALSGRMRDPFLPAPRLRSPGGSGAGVGRGEIPTTHLPARSRFAPLAVSAGGRFPSPSAEPEGRAWNRLLSPCPEVKGEAPWAAAGTHKKRVAESWRSREGRSRVLVASGSCRRRGV